MERCTGMVTHSGMFRSSQCSRNGRFEEDGLHYCKQHLPSEIKQKAEASEVKYNTEWAKKKHGWAIVEAKTNIADFAISYFNQQASFEDIEKAVNNYHRLKAEGPKP